VSVTGQILVAEGITKTFRGPSGSFSIRGVSLKVCAGQIVALRGRSGSGKSALIQILGLLMKPDGGQLSIMGRDTRGMTRATAADFRAVHIGMVFQAFNLLPQLSAYRNVMVPARMPHRSARAAADELLRSVDLADRLRSRPGELSGGEQQRVALARALINQPDLLLADEPTGNLDQVNEDLLLDLFTQYARQGHGVLIATHSERVAARADDVLTLDAGELTASE
jgi:putative ABC transport system ATP-binding protein